jgi:hypothetical protein
MDGTNMAVIRFDGPHADLYQAIYEELCESVVIVEDTDDETAGENGAAGADEAAVEDEVAGADEAAGEDRAEEV